WKEPFLLMLLGLASIGVVLSIRQLLFRPSSQSTVPHRVGVNNDALTKQLKESRERITHLEQRLQETEAKLQNPEPPNSSGTSAAIQSGSPVRDEHVKELVPPAPSPTRYQEALGRAWQYLQVGKFDPATHREILSDLEAAYAVKGLPPEAN